MIGWRSFCVGILSVCSCGYIGYDSVDGEDASNNGEIAAAITEANTENVRTDEDGNPIGNDFFFDDFEGALGDGSDRLEEAGGASLSLTTDPTWSGNQALAFASPATGTSRRARFTRFFSPFLGEQAERVFLRLYLYVPSGFDIDNYIIVADFDDDEGNENGTNKISLDLKDRNRLSIAANSNDTFYHTANDAFERDTWTCTEMELVMSEANGAVRLWVNDTLVIESSSNLDTQPGPGISEFQYGGVFVSNGETDAATFYLDAMVLSRERVGCD